MIELCYICKKEKAEYYSNKGNMCYKCWKKKFA